MHSKVHCYRRAKKQNKRGKEDKTFCGEGIYAYCSTRRGGFFLKSCDFLKSNLNLLYVDASITSGSCAMLTSKRSCTELSTFASLSSDTKVTANPFVPKRPARATLKARRQDNYMCDKTLYLPCGGRCLSFRAYRN